MSYKNEFKNLFFMRGGQGTPGVPGLSPARSRTIINLTLTISIAGLIKNYDYQVHQPIISSMLLNTFMAAAALMFWNLPASNFLLPHSMLLKGANFIDHDENDFSSICCSKKFFHFFCVCYPS